MSAAPPFQQIAIAGVGLIGASLGLAVKAAWPQTRIVGVDPAPGVGDTAVRIGAVDKMAPTLEAAVAGVALVVLAAPVEAILELLPRAAAAAPGALLTDVAGVKGAVHDTAQGLSGEASFIGGHPMAGSQKSGPHAARADLFAGAAWILCPGRRTTEPLLSLLQDLIAGLGARSVLLSPQDHDRAVASISHLPQLLAVALLQLAAGHAGDAGVRMAGRAFGDLTRIGDSSFEIWGGILDANRRHILDALDRMIDLLQGMRRDLEAGAANLDAAFQEAGELRRRLDSRRS